MMYTEPAAADDAVGLPLVGRTALVTGASRGLGRAIADELLQRGATVILNYHDEEPGRENARNAAMVFRADVSNPENVEAMFAAAVKEVGPIDILVNNAGITRDKTMQKMSPEHWQQVLDVNLSGVFHCCRAAIPGMVERKYGRIVNISSVVADLGAFGQTNYAAAKAGILGLTKSLAQEVARYNVTVNAISPGYIETRMVAGMPPAVIDKIKERIPMQRLGKPQDIARAARFLVEEGDYITGTVIRVNGGLFGG